MGLEDRLLSTLLNCDDAGLPVDFDIQPYADKQHIFIEGNGVVDTEAAAYLKETLENFSSILGVNLYPFEVSHDGSCLPHSISKILIGSEILYDGLRACLLKELVENEEWYRKHTDVGRTASNDTAWATEFHRICFEASPTRGAVVGSDKFLGDIHILAFANCLCRPILLLDEWKSMKAGATDRHGLFPPLRRERAEILAFHKGHIPNVLTIAFANRSANHFVPLLCPTNLHAKSDLFNEMITLASSNSYRVNDITDVIGTLENFFLSNSPTTVQRSAQIILRILTDLANFSDGKQNSSNACLTLRIEKNATIKECIGNVNFATNLLLHAGYIVVEENGERVLKYKLVTPVDIKVFNCIAKDVIMNTLIKVNTNEACKLRLQPGRNDVSGAGSTLFGIPSCICYTNQEIEVGNPTIWFENMVKKYGNGSPKDLGGIVWSLNNSMRPVLARNIKKLYTSLKGKFHKLVSSKFRCLPQGQMYSSFDDYLESLNKGDACLLPCISCEKLCSWGTWSPETTITPLEYVCMLSSDEKVSLCPYCEIGLNTVNDTIGLQTLTAISNIFRRGRETNNELI